MKTNFLLLLIITAIISSCSTSYKTGQTPDDVYYSPPRYEYDSVRTERREDNAVYNNSEDREIRRRINNRRYRRYDDRYGRYDDRYERYERYDRYNYPYGYNTYPPVYGNPKLGSPQSTSQPRKTNLGAYSPNPSANDSSGSYNPKLGRINNTGTNNPVRTFGNPPNSSSSNGSSVGNFIRKVFTGDNNNGNNNNTYNSGSSNTSTPARTFERSSTPETNNNSSNNSGNSNRSSSSSENKSGSSAPVRKF